MQRIAATPRPDWQRLVESKGMHFHTFDDGPYWNEAAYYSFTSAEIDQLEAATFALDKMALQAVQHVIDQKCFGLFHIPPAFVDYVIRSWDEDEHSIYARFDLAYDGRSPPKLLEYNADTPTALLEAAVVQWFWLKDTHPEADQFNTIHERLLEVWEILRKKLEGEVFFTSLRGNVEDYMTVNYLRDVAIQAGFDTAYIAVEDIGQSPRLRTYVDLHERPLRTVFKLYPWEWLLSDQFGRNLPFAGTRWFEPPWKMLLSNKAILPVLWELFPDSPYLLRTEFEPFDSSYVRKPITGREGANIAVVENGQTVLETKGPYGELPSVYQQWNPLPEFAGRHPVIGSWLVNGYACGIGIREDAGRITQNTSQFVPHLFEKDRFRN
jgi:glutathionylspermidine synthase